MSEATVRETKEVTVAGYKLVVLTYMTGRELRETQRVLLEKLELGQDANGKTEVSGLKGDMIMLQQNKYVETLVKSVTRPTGEVVTGAEILNAILDLPAKDSVAILEYVSSVAEGKEVASN